MSKEKCVVILSGGQDSSTCAFWAKNQDYEVHCVSFDYNQRHIRELEAAANIAKLVGAASHEIIKLGPILKGRSPLTNPEESLETYKDYESMDAIIGDRVELTFVPMRNALFLTIGANRASCIGASALVTGVCQADNANYPDCRESFVISQEYAIAAALGAVPGQAGHISIQAPLLHLAKEESIQLAVDLVDAYPALAFTHTAYDGQYPPVGNDHASVLRAHGFERAGLPDPLVLRAWMAGVMDLPATHNYGDQAVIQEVCSHISRLQQELDA